MRLVIRLARWFVPRMIALLAATALLAPTAAVVVSAEGAAWFPGHGHVFLNNEAAARPHAHP